MGCGIGSALLNHAKAAMSRRLHPMDLSTDNEGARRFTGAEVGLRAIRFSDGEGNEEKTPDVLYEWRPGRA